MQEIILNKSELFKLINRSKNDMFLWVWISEHDIVEKVILLSLNDKIYIKFCYAHEYSNSSIDEIKDKDNSKFYFDIKKRISAIEIECKNFFQNFELVKKTVQDIQNESNVDSEKERYKMIYVILDKFIFFSWAQ